MIHSSQFWIAHYKENLTKKRIDWSVEPCLSTDEKDNILNSLKAWQLGETSDGTHLIAASTRHANKIKDPNYVDAVRLFIKEEQKHGNNLGRYIDSIGEQRIKKDWGDTLFRKVRYLNTSMELWTITVLIVESAAQIFYQALHDATDCKLLRSICRDILIDEAHHIKFQNERLAIIFERKGFYNKAFSLLLYSFLFFGTIHLIWFGHRKMMKSGGMDLQTFMWGMYYKFFSSLKFVHQSTHAEQGVLELA